MRLVVVLGLTSVVAAGLVLEQRLWPYAHDWFHTRVDQSNILSRVTGALVFRAISVTGAIAGSSVIWYTLLHRGR